MKTEHIELAAWRKLPPADKAFIIGGIGFTFLWLSAAPFVHPILASLVLIPLFNIVVGLSRYYRIVRKIMKGELLE